MSETLKVLETRRSCRAFKPELIEEEKLQAIIKAGTYAATGMGRQSPIIIAVTNKELRDKLSVMNAKFMGKDESFDPFYGAQELLIVLANKAMPTYLYDGTLVLGNLMNAAADLGVDSCWIHRAKEEFASPEGQAAAPAVFSYLLIVISTFPSGITGPHSTSILFTWLSSSHTPAWVRASNSALL